MPDNATFSAVQVAQVAFQLGQALSLQTRYI